MSLCHLETSQLKCKVEFNGLLISFSFKLLLLVVGSWAVFYRTLRATLPQIHSFRALITALLFVFLLSFWLFYGVRLVEQRRKIQYADIVKYATSLLDSLIGLYYFSCLLLELCHSGQSQFLMKVVRNPDGESQSFPIGKLSIQRAAAHILELYYAQFSINNSYLEQIPDKTEE